MAFPVVASFTEGQTSGTTIDLDVPSGTSAGDLLVAYIIGTGQPDVAGTIFSRTLQGQFAGWATGSEGSTISLGIIGGGSTDANYIVLRITGASGFEAPGGSGPDPASYTSIGGAADNLWLAGLLAAKSTTGLTITAPPAGFTEVVQSAAEVDFFGLFGKLAVAQKDDATGTVDAGTWTENADIFDDNLVLVIRPLKANGITSIAQQASATSTASTIAWPAVAAGDFAILADLAVGAPAFVTPTGFSNIHQQSNGTHRACISYKRCVGTESGNITGMAGATENDKVLVTFRGNVAATGHVIHLGDGDLDTSDPVIDQIDANGAKKPAVYIAVYGATNSVTVRDLLDQDGNNVKDGEVGTAGTDLFIAWVLLNANDNIEYFPASGDFGINLLHNFYFELEAAVPATQSFPPYRANAGIRAALRR